MDGWMDGARWKCRFEVKVWMGGDGMGCGGKVGSWRWRGLSWRGCGIGGEGGWIICGGEGEEGMRSSSG